MLDKNEINLQKVTILLSQLIDQIRVTETNKKNLDIEDVLKHINQTFKTTNTDKAALKDLQKIIKNLPNNNQFEKLLKSLNILDHTFKDPDIKQLKNLNISANNISSEINLLVDTLKNINISKNEKANLILLSKAIAEGHRLYAVQGFGKNADQFYKNATISQLLLLKNMDKNIKDGTPLKGLGGSGVLDKAKGLATSGPITATLDTLFKAGGFGELPGQVADLFLQMNKQRESRKDQANASRIGGIQGAKDASRASMQFNEDKLSKLDNAINQTSGYKEGLTVELSNAIAKALRTSESGVDARFAKDEAPHEVDIMKLQDAITQGTLSKNEIEDLIKTKYTTTNEKGEADSKISDMLIEKVHALDGYKKSIDEYQEAKIATAKELQAAQETFAELAISMKEVLNKELDAEFKEISKIIDRNFKNLNANEKSGLKNKYYGQKLESIRESYGIENDEQEGVSEDARNNLKKQYEKYSEITGSSKSSESINKLVADEETKRILQERGLLEGFKSNIKIVEKVQFKNEELLEKFKEQENEKTKNHQLSNVLKPPGATPTIPEELRQKVIQESAEKAIASAQAAGDNGAIDIEKTEEHANRIYVESMEDLIQSFKEQDLLANQKQVESLKKILEGGTVNVRVTNLNDVAGGSRVGSGVEAAHGSSESPFGDI